MMRDELTAALKDAMKAKDTVRLSTIRLVQAAIKDRDIANRTAGKAEASDEDIAQLLAKLVKQREESARIYDENARAELADKERAEIAVIKTFMPAQMSDEDIRAAAAQAVAETGAQGPKDMGKVIGFLKEHHAGKMDFAKASGIVKELLK